MVMIGFSETEIERLIVLLKKSVKRNQMEITRLNPNGDARQQEKHVYLKNAMREKNDMCKKLRSLCKDKSAEENDLSQKEIWKLKELLKKQTEKLREKIEFYGSRQKKRIEDASCRGQTEMMTGLKNALEETERILIKLYEANRF
ncbi:MAG: hypothetical protein FWD39_01670 [Clostridiales bacterium]|nr:hypothetical protein [Clostridiales bacterium]